MKPRRLNFLKSFDLEDLAEKSYRDGIDIISAFVEEKKQDGFTEFSFQSWDEDGAVLVAVSFESDEDYHARIAEWKQKQDDWHRRDERTERYRLFLELQKEFGK
jgi:hypothetical protein